MDAFGYIAITNDNKEEKGKIEAEDIDEAYRILYGRGLFVSSLKPMSKDVHVDKKLKGNETADFCRQVGNMLSSGIPLIKAVGLMKNRNGAPKLKRIYVKIYKSIQKGESFSKALEKCGKAFDNILISMVKAGEASGSLDATMIKMADFYEKQYKLNKKVKGAMTYPMVLVVLVIVVVIAMFTIILPNFFGTFEGMELPALTRFLMAVSSAMVNHAGWLLFGSFAVVITVIALSKLTVVRINFDKLKLHIPVIGGLNQIIYTARFSRTLSSLYTSGLGMVASLSIAINTVNSPYIASQFDKVIRTVKEGENLSTALKDVDGFDSKLIDSVYIGEESGSLDKMLLAMADIFDYDAEMATASLTAIMEPVMIVIIACIVGVIAMGVMTPLMGVYQNVDSMSY